MKIIYQLVYGYLEFGPKRLSDRLPDICGNNQAYPCYKLFYTEDMHQNDNYEEFSMDDDNREDS